MKVCDYKEEMGERLKRERIRAKKGEIYNKRNNIIILQVVLV